VTRSQIVRVATGVPLTNVDSLVCEKTCKSRGITIGVKPKCLGDIQCHTQREEW
jgi:hypothetical protein